MPLAVTTPLTLLDEMDTDGGIGVLETDFAYTGTGCVGIDVDIETWVLENVSLAGGAPIDFSGHFHIYACMLCMTQPTLDLEANGGMGVGIMDSAGNWRVWYVGGKDTYNGGWDVRSAYTGEAHDLESATAPVLTDIIGIVTYWKCTQKSKLAQNCFMDRTAYGNGPALVITGTNTTVNIGWPEVLSVADLADATRGYLKAQTGSFVPKGAVQIGDNVGVLATTFSDDFNILIFGNTPVSPTSNAIVGAGNATGATSITLKSQVIKSAGQPFAFDMTDPNLDTFSMTGTTLANAGLVDFKAGQTVTGDVFNGCGLITPRTAIFASNTVKGSAELTSFALLMEKVHNISKITYEDNFWAFGVNPALNGDSFTEDGGTFSGNTADVYNLHATNAVTISAVNGSTVSTSATAGGIVTIDNAVTISITALDDATGLPIQDASVVVKNAITKATIISGRTLASGIYSESINYTADIDFVGWVRQMDLVGTDYVQKDISGTITTAGASLTVRLLPI